MSIIRTFHKSNSLPNNISANVKKHQHMNRLTVKKQYNQTLPLTLAKIHHSQKLIKRPRSECLINMSS